VNLGCDTSLQRSADTFLFQLNDGAATNESTLVSPASITPPAVNGNVSLAMTTTTPGDSTLTMQGQDTIIAMNNQGGVNQINMQGNNTSINLSSNADATLSLVGGGAGQPGASSSTILLGSTGALGVNDILFGNPTTTGIALYQTTTTPGQLSVGNNFTSTNIASFNQTTNNVTLGNLAAVGSINLNASTVIKESASGANGLALSPTSATQSVIAQTISNSGTLNLGSSVQNSDIIALRDTGAANTGSILIGGNGGTGIVMTGSINNAATTITTDRTTGNFAVLSIGANIGVPVLQFSDSGAAFVENVSTGINSTLTLGGDLNMGTDGVIRNYANYQTTGNAALGVGATGTITNTNPPPNGVGLYCITIYAPSDITANVSGVAFWNGSVWFGGSTGNAAFRIQTAPAFTSLTLFNTSSVAMVGVWQSNVFQILGPTTA